MHAAGHFTGKRAGVGVAAVDRIVRMLDLMGNLARHREVRAAIAAPLFDRIRARQPQIAMKYLNPAHLVAGLTSSQRAAAMVHHYTVLETCFADEVREHIFGDGIRLWSSDRGGLHHVLSLGFSHPTDNEGELSLEYRIDDVLLYVLSFTFVPGSLVDVEPTTVALVTRLQGQQGRFDAIRAAMQSLDGLAARALLFAALEGIATALGQTVIVGVSAARQVCYEPGAGNLAAAYDGFFTELGATPVGDFYRIDLPLVERPITTIRAANRGRVSRQRAIKHDAAEAAWRILRPSGSYTSVG